MVAGTDYATAKINDIENTMTNAENAIQKSIMQDRIVTIEAPAPADIEKLKNECDDWVENGSVIEFWGKDDGDNWRVHVASK